MGVLESPNTVSFTPYRCCTPIQSFKNHHTTHYRLTQEDSSNFLIWLEEAHGGDIAKRSQLPPRQMEVPSLTSRSGAGEVKEEEVRAPLREQYGASSGYGWTPVQQSSGESERRTRKEPYSGGDDVTVTNPILLSDIAAMGRLNGQSISTLTFVMLTCRLPPQDKDLRRTAHGRYTCIYWLSWAS